MTQTETTEPSRHRRVRRSLIVAVILLVPLAIHAIWDQVEATLLAREIADIARRGEPVNLLTSRGELSDPELRRSAALYAAAAELARWQSDFAVADKDIEDHTTDSRIDTAAIHKYLADAEPALQLLAAATPLRFTAFGSIAPDLAMNESSLQTLNAMNCLSADMLSLGGDGDAAADTLVRSTRLHRTLPIPFYRNIAERRLLGSLRILLLHSTPGRESLQRLQTALAEWPDDDGVAADAERRRAWLLGDYWPYPAEQHSWALRARQGRSWSVGESVGFVVFRPLLTHALRGQLGPYDEVLNVMRQPWPAKLDAAHAVQQRYAVEIEEASHYRPTVRWLTLPPAMAMFQFPYLLTGGANLAIRRIAIAAMAVERYRRDHGGQPPAALQALVPQYLPSVPQDPFSGQPLILNIDATSYVLYSVDVNRKDDGGVFSGVGTGVKERWRAETDPTPRDIGIRVPFR